MDVRIIRQLTKLMQENDLVEVEVESPDLKVRLAKAQPVYQQFQPALAAPMAPPSAPPAATAQAAERDEYAGCHKIISPLPGTVYLKPNPESPIFVKEGERVEDGQVVCLVEAMKVFNEIKCEGASGTVRKICVEDGQPVEYGTVLFLVG